MLTVPQLCFEETLNKALAPRTRRSIKADAPLFEMLHERGVNELDGLADFKGKEFRNLADAFLAALEYYEHDCAEAEIYGTNHLKATAHTVMRGDYFLLPLEGFSDYDDAEAVGRALFLHGTNADWIPDWLESYVDFERIGKDDLDAHNGIVTDWGYFSPNV